MNRKIIYLGSVFRYFIRRSDEARLKPEWPRLADQLVWEMGTPSYPLVFMVSLLAFSYSKFYTINLSNFDAN